MERKRCSRCKKNKKVNQFYNKKYSSTGFSSECKKCSLAAINAKKNYNPDYNGNKVCSKCNKSKPKKEFYKNSQCKDGLYNQCSKCFEIKRLEQRYGLSELEINSLAKQQSYKCAICCKRKKLIVDHCHKTGRVRGLLCTSCNMAIGNLGDTKKSLQKVVDYLS